MIDVTLILAGEKIGGGRMPHEAPGVTLRIATVTWIFHPDGRNENSQVELDLIP